MQIGCDIMLGFAQNNGIAEHLIDYLEYAAGCLAVAFLVNGFDYCQYVGGFQFRDMLFANGRENIGLETIKNGALMFGGKASKSCLVPFQGYILKTVALGNGPCSLAFFFCSAGSMPFARSPLASSRFALASFNEIVG